MVTFKVSLSCGSIHNWVSPPCRTTGAIFYNRVYVLVRYRICFGKHEQYIRLDLAVRAQCNIGHLWGSHKFRVNNFFRKKIGP